MAQRLRPTLLLLSCLSFPAAGLRTEVGTPGRGSQAVATVTSMPLAERRKRIVLQKGNATDPFERVKHFDDYFSGFPPGIARDALDVRSPVCVTQAGRGAQRCTLLSINLCTEKSRRIPRTDESLGKCFERRKSCAVVGSSGHLLNASWGASIDGHDLVIRINNAPAGSASKMSEHFPLSGHVGTRTDVRFVNEYGLAPDDVRSARPECIFLHEPMLPKSCGGQRCWMHPGACPITCPKGVNETSRSKCHPHSCDVSRVTCRAASQEKWNVDWGHNHVFLDNVHSGIADLVVPHSTAGFKAAIYAMSICDSVSIFGFGPTCDGSVGSRYYQDSDSMAVSEIYHHYAEELALLIRASEAGTKAIIPPEARSWITAQSVTVALPTCVNKEVVSRLRQTFRGFGSQEAGNCAPEASFKVL